MKLTTLSPEARHQNWILVHCFKGFLVQDFPGGAVVKNPPATARDTGSISDPGRSHMPWSN